MNAMPLGSAVVDFVYNNWVYFFAGLVAPSCWCMGPCASGSWLRVR